MVNLQGAGPREHIMEASRTACLQYRLYAIKEIGVKMRTYVAHSRCELSNNVLVVTSWQGPGSFFDYTLNVYTSPFLGSED